MKILFIDENNIRRRTLELSTGHYDPAAVQVIHATMLNALERFKMYQGEIFLVLAHMTNSQKEISETISSIKELSHVHCAIIGLENNLADMARLVGADSHCLFPNIVFPKWLDSTLKNCAPETRLA
jgi:hypothetical protein